MLVKAHVGNVIGLGLIAVLDLAMKPLFYKIIKPRLTF